MADTLRHRRIEAYIEREENVSAWVLVSELLNEQPDDPKALYYAGAVLRNQGHTGMALQFFRRALAFVPNQPNVWMHFACCLHDTNQYEAAREALEKVRAINPRDPMAPANIAATYVQQGDALNAVRYADQAYALADAVKDNEHPSMVWAAKRSRVIAGVAKGFGCLGLGRWAEGWQYSDYLYGEVMRTRKYRDPENEEPTWDGTKGQTVVVQADQGLGEMLMFMQMLPQMRDDCKQLIVETNPRLEQVYRQNLPGVEVYGTLKQDRGLDWPKAYSIDASIHISALGRFYRQSDADFPRQPYLAPDPKKAERWRAWLSQFPRPWVGLAWRGGIQRTNEATRSMPLASWAPILKQGGTFVSLAYQNVGLEVASWNIEHPRAQVLIPDIDNDRDFGEWVALISCLDHTVSVLTTVLHVCGALGKRCSVMVPTVCQWQHVYGGDGMLWYPEGSVVNYRQKEAGNWAPVIDAVADNYRNFVLPLARAA